MHALPNQMRYQAALLPDKVSLGVQPSCRKMVSERRGTMRHSAAHSPPHNAPHNKRAATVFVAPRGPDQPSERTARMADSYPKKILPLLEGKIGELRIMRFWSHVDMRGPDECWTWQRSLTTSGYGRFKIASYETVTASRMALICTKKQEPEGMSVLHHCDNPPCCNPHHLYFGTIAQNNADKIARGRANSGDQSGANNGAAKLNEEQFAQLIEGLKAGLSNKHIAASLPVTHSMVSLVRVGKMWRAQSKALGWEPKAQFVRKAA